VVEVEGARSSGKVVVLRANATSLNEPPSFCENLPIPYRRQGSVRLDSPWLSISGSTSLDDEGRDAGVAYCRRGKQDLWCSRRLQRPRHPID
jgi:hypothetical protein